MCGIFGYIGENDAVNKLFEGLKMLEYRGYDSAGFAVVNDSSKLKIFKKEGKIDNIQLTYNTIENKSIYNSTYGIGHTRWATHGEVNEVNSHPHISYKENFAVVHNGIIENYTDIITELNSNNIYMKSQTDSEVIAHLLDYYMLNDKRYQDWLFMKDTNNVIALIKDSFTSTINRISGSYAIVFITPLVKDTVFAYKHLSPLIVGKNDKEYFLSSDIPTLSGVCDKAYLIDDDEMCIIAKNKLMLYKNGQVVHKAPIELEKTDLFISKDIYSTYMEKEINEIPKAIYNTLSCLNEKKLSEQLDKIPNQIERVYFIGCGTAFHAGMFGSYYMEEECKIPCKAILASEFISISQHINKNTLCIFVSQSGETADTLQAIRKAKKHKAYTVAITNVNNSSICFISDSVIFTKAGVELGVASTKAFNSQLCALILITNYLKYKNTPQFQDVYKSITDIVYSIKRYLSHYNKIKAIAEQLTSQDKFFFIGRGYDYITAREGALKLKEIAYVFCEAMCGGELKHGTLALISNDTYVVAVITSDLLYDKMYNTLMEVKARGAKVICISNFDELSKISDIFLPVESVDYHFSPLFSIIPLQLLALYTSTNLQYDPDKPRNLAKSVTVE